MFLLKGDNSIYVIPKVGLYKIGRLQGDIVIKHSSISRKHAEIVIKDDATAYIRDCNSKYFTRHQGKILRNDENKELKHGDQILFGEVAFSFQTNFKIVTCTSGVKDGEKELRTIIKKLDGTLLKDWDDTCNYLTTNELFVTLKVLHAILDNKKIVTVSFWKTFLENMKTNKLLPEASKFYPPFGESMINIKHVEYNANRTKLFNNKTFAFWSKKHQTRMGDIIKKAGGDHILLTQNLSETQLLQKMNTCVVTEPEDSSLQETFKNVLSEYVDSGKRLIPIQEIVFAILHCSCDEDCNPYFNRTKKVFTKGTEKISAPRKIVDETESQASRSFMESQSQVVPASFEEFDMPSTSKKGNTSIEETQIPAKRIRLDPDVEISGIAHVTEFKRNQNEVSAALKRSNDSEPEPMSKKIKIEVGSDERPNPFAIFSKKTAEKSAEKSDKKAIMSMLFQKKPKEEETSVEVKVESNENEDVITVDVEKKNNNPKRKNNLFVNPRSLNQNKQVKEKTKSILSESRTINFSEIEHNVSNFKWIDPTVKSEEDEIQVDNRDDEERAWCEKFNNTVIIMPKLLHKIEINRESEVPSISETISNGKINYKKFRKQTITRSRDVVICSKVINSYSNLNVDYGISDDEDERNI